VLKRSKLAAFAAILLLLGALSARPTVLVGMESGDSTPSFQAQPLFLALSRPLDVAKLLPAKAKRDAPAGQSVDPALPAPDQATETAAFGLGAGGRPLLPEPWAPRLAAWPRGPPAV
jgi:hypothetical protein